MTDNLEEIPFQLTEEEFDKWKKNGKVEYPYNESDDYVIKLKIAEGVHYRKVDLGQGKFMYSILPREIPVKKQGYFIPVCSICERIRVDDEHNFWLDKSENPAEYDSIIRQHEPTHTYCPDCFKKEADKD